VEPSAKHGNFSSGKNFKKEMINSHYIYNFIISFIILRNHLTNNKTRIISMTIFKPIYPPLHVSDMPLFPELNNRKAPLDPIYVNPAQVVSIDMSTGVPTLHLTDGRCIETQFPTTEHLEYYMATENNRPIYRSTQFEFSQVTDIGSTEDSGVQKDSSATGDCQSEVLDAGYTPAGPIYAGGSTLPVLEVEETTWGGVLDLSSYTDKA
jgi:hypothetical protein